MELDNKTLSSYIGGDAMMEEHTINQLQRGAITSAIIAGGDLMLNFGWIAVNTGSARKPEPGSWRLVRNRSPRMTLKFFTITVEGDGVIVLTSSLIGETVRLYPKGYAGLEEMILDN